MGNWFKTTWDSIRGVDQGEKRSFEAKYASISDDSFLKLLGLSEFSANSTPQTAMGISTFFGAVRVISNLVSSTPFGTYIELEGGGSKRDRKHSLDYLLSVRTNNQMSPIIAKRTIVSNAIVWGFSVSRIRKNVRGEIQYIQPYPSSTVTILEDARTGLLFFQVIDKGERIYLSQDEVIFIKDLSFDGNKGASITNWQSRAIKLNLLTDSFIEKYYEKGTFIAGFLESPSIDINNAEKVKQYKQNVLKSLDGDENGFGMAIIGANGKWHSVGKTPVESDLMNTFNKSANDIAKMFGIPLSLIGDTEKQTSWGSGVQQMFIGVTRTVLIPLAVQIEEEFNYKCFSKKEIAEGRFTKFNFRALLRGDSTEYANFVRTMVNIGAYNLDEVRAFDEMPPIEGGHGKRHLVQGAMVPLDKIDEIAQKKNNTHKNGSVLSPN